MNFLPGTLALGGDARAIRIGGTDLPLAPDRPVDGAVDGQPVLLGLRPEHLTRAHGEAPAEGCFRCDATIELVQPTGSRSYATFRLAGEPVMAELQAHDVSRPGEHVRIDVNMTRASIFDRRTERAL
jgi:multiple sugar transport system ATP-binding protein